MRKIACLVLVLIVSSCAKEESPTPSDDPRDAFVGAWDCEEESQITGTTTFEVHIGKSSVNSSQITIENFYQYGFSFKPYAEISSAGTDFTIPSQVVKGNNIKGSGTLLGTSTINMSYTVDNGSDVDNVTAVLTKK